LHLITFDNWGFVLMKNISFWIVGPICAGKTTVASEVSKNLSIPFLSETNCEGGLLGLLKDVGKYEVSIIEHTDLFYNYCKIAGYYNDIVVFYLDVSEDLLNSHKNQRIKEGIKGDFIRFDPVEMKKDIERQLSEYNNDVTSIKIFKIKQDKDYEEVKSLITDCIGSYLS